MQECDGPSDNPPRNKRNSISSIHRLGITTGPSQDSKTINQTDSNHAGTNKLTMLGIHSQSIEKVVVKMQNTAEHEPPPNQIP
jgi:hypothetical protein